MPGKIYLVSLNGVPKYVGFTSRTIEERWKEHIFSSKKSKCPTLHNAINKYGPEAFTVTEIYSSDDVDHTLNVMEPQFIREYNTHVDVGGYNISHGGDSSTRGRKHTQQAKEKMRKAKLGKIHSKESKEKMRQSHLGMTHSKETKEKMRQTCLRTGRTAPSTLGMMHSQETKEKIRQGQLRHHRQSKPDTFDIISAT